MGDVAATLQPTRGTNQPVAKPLRLMSIDAYRGFVMLLMASEGFRLADTAANFLKTSPDNRFWQTVQYQFSHVPWLGCGLWDLLQPSFMFLVGVALAFSAANRQARGQSYGRMFLHACYRSVVLVLIGLFLSSHAFNSTRYRFDAVLAQIGLGYPLLFLLWGRPRWLQGLVAALILVGYWAWFALTPVPPAEFDWAAVKADDVVHLEGFAAHWSKNANPAHVFEVWLLNRFPHNREFVANAGGFVTLNFIPSLATMIFGLMSGELLRGSAANAREVGLLLAWGGAGLAAGWLLDVAGLCPIVRRIWTPSWTLFSTGWTAILLAAFYQVIDVWQWRRGTLPLLVIGTNSILAYVLHYIGFEWIIGRLRAHLGREMFTGYGWLTPYEPTLLSLAAFLVLWLFLYWFYRQRLFVKV